MSDKPPPCSMFDQLSEAGLFCVGALVGAENCPTFRNSLRDTPAIAEPFTLGDAARAYLRSRLVYLERVMHTEG